MSSQSASDIGARKVRVFSAVWSEELGAAIAAAAPIEGYTMSLVGEDGRAVIAAVAVGAALACAWAAWGQQGGR